MADEPLLLNLDELTSEDVKVIILGGVRHTAQEMTVEGYIERVKRSRGLAQAGETVSMDVQIREAVTLLGEIFTTVPKEAWDKMSMAKLSKVIDFALKSPKDIAEAAQAASGNA